MVNGSASMDDFANWIEADAAALAEVKASLDTGLTETEGNFEGASLYRITSFPYPHADDRERMQLSLFERPAAGEGLVGEYIIWTEIREDDHDGYREAARHNGYYFGYVGLEEREAAFFKAMKLFTYKTGRMISPFCRNDETSEG
jgi:hypothetical protein